MVFAAIFSLIPDLAAGLAAGKKSLVSTLLGCEASRHEVLFSTRILKKTGLRLVA